MNGLFRNRSGTLSLNQSLVQEGLRASFRYSQRGRGRGRKTGVKRRPVGVQSVAIICGSSSSSASTSNHDPSHLLGRGVKNLEDNGSSSKYGSNVFNARGLLVKLLLLALVLLCLILLIAKIKNTDDPSSRAAHGRVCLTHGCVHAGT